MVAPARSAPGAASSTLPLAVDALHFRAGGKQLLADVSFTVQADTANIVLGPNGAGKSLLMRLCHGLLQPQEGHITWHGLSPVRARIRHAMIFQQPVMLRRSVAANLEYPLAIRRLPRAERRRRVAAALHATDLSRLAQVPATRLSGGEKQRVAIARAWVLRPEVLLLDEPSANLDPRAILAIEQLIHAMRAQGATIIMTTHDMAQARRLGERVLFLNRGHLLEDSTAETFFTQPRSREARKFLAGELLT